MMKNQVDGWIELRGEANELGVEIYQVLMGKGVKGSK